MMPAASRRVCEQAFDDLTVASSTGQEAFPTSIWQILQHLLAWQAHQLAQLRGVALAESFAEKHSWQAARVPPSQAVLRAAVSQFKQQLAQLRVYAEQAQGDAPEALAQGLLLQEVALHLSFHLGEVVLIRRLQGSCPLPAHTQDFLRS